MKKTGSLPDLKHAEEAQAKAAAGVPGPATSSPRRQSQEAVPGPSVLPRESAGPQPLPQRPSWQQPMQPVSRLLSMEPCYIAGAVFIDGAVFVDVASERLCGMLGFQGCGMQVTRRISVDAEDHRYRVCCYGGLLHRSHHSRKRSFLFKLACEKSQRQKRRLQFLSPQVRVGRMSSVGKHVTQAPTILLRSF